MSYLSDDGSYHLFSIFMSLRQEGKYVHTLKFLHNEDVQFVININLEMRIYLLYD